MNEIYYNKLCAIEGIVSSSGQFHDRMVGITFISKTRGDLYEFTTIFNLLSLKCLEMLLKVDDNVH